MKAVITVVGKDRVGIIHDVTKILLDNNINILDISQTILGGYFTMMMITDISQSTNQIDELKQLFENIVCNSSLDITIQHEDIFNSMHNI
ncbi:ACT domain-containing protein [Clostridium tarantellae]|uniref:UPF0237 protein GBZ86_06700 n=1 Tax=Clostridium tarantellae TaxID=39493 RepID=A0A6I1MMU8_9CLOT|nr:ACT domain-containing protein [Clostridium tarantellae]MPQ43447.1 ACT domain-containing protein [Clostridium tarantellae]